MRRPGTCFEPFNNLPGRWREAKGEYALNGGDFYSRDTYEAAKRQEDAKTECRHCQERIQCDWCPPQSNDAAENAQAYDRRKNARTQCKNCEKWIQCDKCPPPSKDAAATADALGEYVKNRGQIFSNIRDGPPSRVPLCFGFLFVIMLFVGFVVHPPLDRG